MITVKSLASSSLGNAYTISDGESTLLLECGIPWKKIQKGLGYKTTGLAGCLVSHYHGDHAKSVADACRNGIDVYASAETFDHVGALNHHRAKPVLPGQPWSIGTWIITAFPTEHDTPGSLGFLMRNNEGEPALFLTDSAYSRYRFPPLHTVIIEANFSLDIVDRNIEEGVIDASRRKRLIETHMSIERVCDLLKANDLSQCRAIHLIHLSEDNSDEERFLQMVVEETGIPTYVEAA